jgi:alpha-ketoglutarate-dependent taurine dioxygenase
MPLHVRFFGDLTSIPSEDLDHIDEVTRNNLVPRRQPTCCLSFAGHVYMWQWGSPLDRAMQVSVMMEKGDVVLVDNYQCLHGRDVFTGERLHAVTWFR